MNATLLHHSHAQPRGMQSHFAPTIAPEQRKLIRHLRLDLKLPTRTVARMTGVSHMTVSRIARDVQ